MIRSVSIFLASVALVAFGTGAPARASTCDGAWVLTATCTFTTTGVAGFGANVFGTASVVVEVIDASNVVVATCTSSAPGFTGCFDSAIVPPGSYTCRVGGTFVGQYKCSG